ncbi:MAG: hydrogenase maturation protease [Euryarchaeota archaeon]|nr:hydrogenase maturation protease [Euryarchaeota archaeon]
MTENDCLPDWYTKSTLVLGCGNPLFGDDGFGPAVAAALQKRATPEDVHVMDVGISAREVLFPLVVGETLVRNLIIIDAVDFADRGRVPGEIFEVPIDDIPAVKSDDFSMHQVASSNLLRELRDRRNIKVIVLACQTGSIPDHVAPGLSGPVRDAVEKMCEFVLKRWGDRIDGHIQDDG